MATTHVAQATLARPAIETRVQRWLHDPKYQAFWMLRVGFFLAPVLFGIDKYFNWMTYWPKYLWIGFPHLLSVSPQDFMYVVGAVEIVAGLLVLAIPRFAAYVVAGWLAGIITNLVIISAAPGRVVYWDIALRDFGLLIGALALGRLAAGIHRTQIHPIGEN
jgi:uncharacterized membrane protein YphA (DoxX/SURF4 family)